ncbi:MAG: TSUP family transporter [Solirubrobacterales bacterium]|nr:TSUP family transporter [Solirubrobacterales bacterium]
MIGARVPSTSQSTAARSGCARRGSISLAIRSRLAGAALIRHLVSLRVARGRLSDRTLKLAALGTAAGAFSGVFGVGGGSVIVPLLIFAFAYGEREATGTSMLAIVLIGALAAIAQGFYGNVELLKGVLIGIPAIGGVIAGTALQRRVSERSISILFAALLVLVALELLIP